MVNGEVEGPQTPKPMNNALVRLDPGPQSVGRRLLSLRLAGPEGGRPLPVRTYLTNGYWGDWLRVSLPPPQLDHEEIAAVGRWACCHADWFDAFLPGEA